MTRRKFWAGESVVPDCANCARRDGCANYEEGTFCTLWTSREPEDRGPDPNEKWRQGEEADF